MSDALTNRADCMAEISRRIGEDPWVAQFALFKALQACDLRVVNDVLEALEDAARSPQWLPGGLLDQLRKERWG